MPSMLLAASPRLGLLQGQALSNDPASSGACKRKEAFDVEHGGAYLTVQQQWCLWPGMCCLARYIAAWPSHVKCSSEGRACMLLWEHANCTVPSSDKISEGELQANCCQACILLIEVR